MSYEFADRTIWGDDRLLARLYDVQEAASIPHNEPRATELARELVHMEFEFDMRCAENAQSKEKPE